MKKVKNLVRSNKGITLIALIITVIVMLILAGIAINLTIGDNGIFKKSDEGAKIYQNAANNEATSLNNIDKEMGDLIEQYRNENKNYTMVEGVPVPKGFTHTEGTKETGFVIKNDTDGNEFVWIPVEEGCGYSYERYAFSKEGWSESQRIGEIDTETNSKKIEWGTKPTTVSNIKRVAWVGKRIAEWSPSYFYFVEAMSSDELVSVSEYKGYYIARYETGISTEITDNLTEDPVIPETATSKEVVEILGNPLVQSKKVPYVFITAEQAKGLAENLYSKSVNHVTSKLCSSYAWDTALKFIETKYPGWATNSSEGENCYTDSPEITGYHSVNNIYDIGGNVNEYTTEKCYMLNSLGNYELRESVRRGKLS